MTCRVFSSTWEQSSRFAQYYQTFKERGEPLPELPLGEELRHKLQTDRQPCK